MAARKPKAPVKFQVCGKEWTARFLAASTFTRKHGRKTMAISTCDEKLIEFRIGEMSRETVIHEIFHAFMWEHGAESMDLTAEQIEELCAEMFSKHAEVILATAGIILAALGA